MHKEYEEVHIWQFPPTRTFVLLNGKFRKRFFDLVEEKIGFAKAADLLNNAAEAYSQKRKYNKAHFYSWRTGFKNDKGKKKITRPPIWVLCELSKIIKLPLLDIEKNIISYGASGKSLPISKPKLPLRITPELVSVIFHLCGDGHIGVKKNDVSHYRQVNITGLYNFIKKLKNAFGTFEVIIHENSKIIIPKIITNFYQYYFKLNDCSCENARIITNIKQMPNKFLIAGLTSFIIDEGHISDVIEIYSKNQALLQDIKEIATKLGYRTYGPKLKQSKDRTDSYRLYISLLDAQKLYGDVMEVAKEFPTCDLAHKTELLKKIVERQTKKYVKTSHGYTKQKILQSLSQTDKTIFNLAKEFKLAGSTIREHLNTLENQNKIKRTCIKGVHIISLNKL